MENCRGALIVFEGLDRSGKTTQGLDFDWCMNADRGLPQPDVVFFVDVKPETLKNRGEFGVERFDDEEFQRKVRHNYQRLTDKYWQIGKVATLEAHYSTTIGQISLKLCITLSLINTNV
ncbi:thymidylate kinase [Trichinella spiralis]|uniref:thymidylate kinase n=1 Tax=Trichinella spiralis TaxID=6334 RepID=UPI0001EFD74D|nr:thymidylate kinase [Trichinella spiralis]